MALSELSEDKNLEIESSTKKLLFEDFKYTKNEVFLFRKAKISSQNVTKHIFL